MSLNNRMLESTNTDQAWEEYKKFMEYKNGSTETPDEDEDTYDSQQEEQQHRHHLHLHWVLQLPWSVEAWMVTDHNAAPADDDGNGGTGYGDGYGYVLCSHRVVQYDGGGGVCCCICCGGRLAAWLMRSW